MSSFIEHNFDLAIVDVRTLVNPVDFSAPSYDDGDSTSNRSRTSQPTDNSRAGPPNRMKPLPESLIFDMR